MKKRILSFFCVLALCLTLLPSAAFAAETDTGKAIQLGTSGISDPISTKDSKGTYCTPSDYVYFGVKGSDPIKWRVLDADKTNDGTTSGMFLLSEYLLDSGVVFESAWNSDDNDGQINPNEWQHSDAQTWCSTFATNTNVFSTAEQAAFLGVAKTDSAESLYSLSWGASSLTENDKVFFLSVRELADYVGSYDGAPGLRATDTAQRARSWWLRSPYADDTSYAGAVFVHGYVDHFRVSTDRAARPAFNLNLNSVLFTSAAEGGKAANGMDSGLTAVGGYDGNEWKLTLLDSSRNFSISNAAINSSGNTIGFSYSNAQTGTNEYISVVIVDNGAITHYGRILQLDGTTNGASGTASLTLPAGVTLSDTTKLYVFNEQYNGGEKDDTKLTDYASAFIDVQPVVDTTAPTLTAGTATRTGAATATVKFTSDEAGSYYYEVVNSGESQPTINTTGAETACVSGENTISLTSLSDAGAKDIYIVAKDAVGNVSSSLKIEIPIFSTYTISASSDKLDFGSQTVGYTEAPAAQTVTITNTGNQTVTVTLPTSTNYTITAGTAFVDGTATLAPNGTAEFTVQPKTGLAVGSYSETLTISSDHNTSAEVSLAFTVDPKSLDGAQVQVTGEYTYDGTEQQPSGNDVTVTLDGEPLTADDYTLSYTNNTDAGEATVTATGKGNYSGTATGSFTINKATPTVTGVAVSDSIGTIYDTTDISTITLTYTDSDTPGTVKLDDGQTLHAGSGTYNWTFTPTDTANYNNATGTITLYVVSSSGGGGSSNTTTETTKNPDGSTTTTVTNKVTGTVTETTKFPDGSKEVVETKKDGTVTTTTTDTTGNKTQVVENTDGTKETTITNKDGSSSATTVDETGKTQAEVKLPAAVVEDAQGEAVTLPMPEVPITTDRETAPTVTVDLPGGGSAKVEIPVEDVTPGTVAVIVKADGTEEVIKTSLTTENGVAVTLSDGDTVKVVDNSKTFEDVPATYWGAEAVDFATSRELFVGTSETTFAPDTAMTRAMIVTVLARFEGVDTTTGSTWYEAGQQWAMQNGVSDGSNMDASLTREQLVTMFYRYAQSKGYDTTQGGMAIREYADFEQISDYAAEAMTWAVNTGIINGTSSTTISPQGPATRAQVATILMRFIEGMA